MERTIEASAAVRAEFEAVAGVLRDPALLLQPHGGTAGRYRVEMVADLRDGGSVRQTVVVDLGVPDESEDGDRCTLAWRPEGHERLLPAFDGVLEAHEDVTGGCVIRILGRYHPPFGALGAIADSVALQRVARRTLADFTRSVACAVDAAVDRRRGEAWIASGPWPDDLRPMPSEHWLG